MSPQEQSIDAPDELPPYLPLRSGLELHHRDGSEHVVLEDISRKKFFRLGAVEALFIRSLRTTSSPAEALRTTNLVDASFSAGTALALCKWLVMNELTPVEPSTTTLPRRAPATNPIALAFFWKVPLFNPDRWLRNLVSNVGWLFSPQAMLFGVLVFVIGLLQTAGDWSEFVRSYENLVTSWRGLSLVAAWFFLKVIHETAHGATCRRYGGEVEQAGFAMILFFPIAFVNVTSSWRFASRWQRLHVTLAGVAAELFIAGVALILWNVLESPSLKQAAADIVLLASVSSLLFNLNPLLKFDGYFALADATGVDNLYSCGQSYARYFGARYILGLDIAPPRIGSRRPAWIKLYGLAAAAYRVFTIAGLLIAAATLFSGAGIVIAFGGIGAFVVQPLAKLALHLHRLWSDGDLSPIRLTLRLGLLTTLMIGAFWFVPTSWTFTSPAIVQYDPPVALRTRTDGFIAAIHVLDGASVRQGQPIVTLRNDDLLLKLSELRKSLAQTEQKVLAARWRRDAAELGEASLARDGLTKQVTELQAEVDALTLRSPVAGTLVARKLHLLTGTHVKAGYELAVVGREDAKRLKVSITQSDAKQSANWLNRQLSIIVKGRPTMFGKIERLDSRADSQPPHEALLAINGGPLVTVQMSADDFELDHPRINGYIKLSASQSRKLRCGERASVRLGTQPQTLGAQQLSYLKNNFPFAFPASLGW